eukprot:463265_1
MELCLRMTVIVWFVLNHYQDCIADTIDCASQPCQNTIIDCLPHQDCFVSCDDEQSCIASVINCPVSGDCSIECSGDQACQDMIINATSSNGNFNLVCEHSTDHCKGIKVYGSTLKTNTGTFTVTCNGDLRACVNSHIHCPITGHCSISCNADTSCRSSQISGPSIQGDLSIACNGERSCFDAIFNGKTSSTLDITGCTASESCSDLTIYCPPNTNGDKHCFMEGNNNLNRDANGGTIIYAIHGFDDIQITYSGTFDASHGGQMFCGNHYDLLCDIKSDDWSCTNGNHHCNSHSTASHNPAPTIAPSHFNITPPMRFINTEALSTSVTRLYTSKQHHKEHDDDDDHIYHYQLSKDRGVTWLLEVRIVFGGCVLLIIVIVTLCCYLCNRHRHEHVDLHVKHKSAHPHHTATISRHFSRTYSHHSLVDRHPYDMSKTMDINEPFHLTKAHSDRSMRSLRSCNIDMNCNPRDSLTPHNSIQSDGALPLNPIQLEIAAVRQLLTMRKMVTDRTVERDRDASDAGSADTTDIIQRNGFIVKPYISDDDTSTVSVTASPKTPVLALPCVSATSMTSFNLNTMKSESRKPNNSLKRSMHQRTHDMSTKPEFVRKIVSKFNAHEMERVRKMKKMKSSSALQCPPQKSFSMKRKSPSSKRQAHKLTLTMTQKSYGSIGHVHESETEMESCSESADKTKTEFEPSTLDENMYSQTETYEPSDPIPTAC